MPRHGNPGEREESSDAGRPWRRHGRNGLLIRSPPGEDACYALESEGTEIIERGWSTPASLFVSWFKLVGAAASRPENSPRRSAKTRAIRARGPLREFHQPGTESRILPLAYRKWQVCLRR